MCHKVDFSRWKNFLNLDVHEGQIKKLILQAFGFDSSYICITLYTIDTFFNNAITT
jgi:hypothetical protein